MTYIKLRDSCFLQQMVFNHRLSWLREGGNICHATPHVEKYRNRIFLNAKQYLATRIKQRYSRINYCPFLQIKANREEPRVDSNGKQTKVELTAIEEKWSQLRENRKKSNLADKQTGRLLS